jgi:hypothetical protein
LFSNRFDVEICCWFNISDRRGFSCWNEELTGGKFDVEVWSYEEFVIDGRWNT